MNHSLAKSLLLFTSTFLVGCGPKANDPAALAETLIVGPEFSANKGLFVPEETRRSLGLKVVDIGERNVSATAEISFRIYEIGGGAVRASGVVAPEQASGLKPGQSVQMRARNGESAAAKIAGISRQMQKATGTVEVLAEIPNATASLSVGAFVTGTVTLGSSETVVSVPRSALLQAIDGYHVYTVSGQHFVRTPVKIGVLNADYAEIKEGLYAGDQIVSEPVMSLWLTELAAIKGGHACCVVPAKGK